MADQTATYYLACHCQAHILQLTLPLDDLFSDNGVCDCSHCLKRRIVWGKAPKGSLKVMKGVGSDDIKLQEYRFGTKSFAHQVSPHSTLNHIAEETLSGSRVSFVADVGLICSVVRSSQMLKATCIM